MKLDDEIKDGVCILIAFVLLVGMLVLIFSGCAWPGVDQHEHDRPWPMPGTNGEYRPTVFPIVTNVVYQPSDLEYFSNSLIPVIQKRDGARFIGVYLGMIAEHDGKGGVQMWSATSGELLRWISFGEFKAIYVDKTRREYQYQ